MKIRQWALLAALGLCTATSAWARDYKVGQVEIDDVWVRASAPGQANGAGYMDIDNDAKAADRLVSVTSDAAERVELHAVQNENGVARMRHLPDGVPVPADGEVKLAPGGYHVMFMKLKQPFTEGAEVPATLKFQNAGEVAVKFKVMPIGHNPGGGHTMHMKH
ncbi:copper chaperone PCu(A)C [Bordetella petrii]|uniref:copper chaperone PCu(A)C n=1 Tax=Bordetella petrii TaxID=94624 RepID=UPI001E384956|nr:copper chaperone PCu(A)C [Bordetella petrii]MCD0503588.1 copper chaperone PCu(A)C [Bordetella petrii]